MKQKANPGIYHHMIFGTPSSLADLLSSPHFSESLNFVKIADTKMKPFLSDSYKIKAGKL
jgi:hypothetical protein